MSSSQARTWPSPSSKPARLGRYPAIADVEAPVASAIPIHPIDSVARVDTDLLTPRQEEIREELLQLGRVRPTPDRELGRRFRERMRRELTDLSASLPDGHRVFVSKHRLAQVHHCEGLLRAQLDQDFSWNLANVRGRVTHRAIEGLIISRYRRRPLQLAQAAIDELAATEDDDNGPGEFLRTLSDGARHDLIRDVNDLVVKFVADWPQITEHWMPRVESPVRLGFGKVRLQAQVDLTLGIPLGSMARTFVVDFKTGYDHHDHAQDARFYALVESVRSLTPPYRVATYYLDSGTFHAEDVDEDLLEAALCRLVDGARKIAGVETGGQVTYTPGVMCRYCPVHTSCTPGRTWLASLSEHGDGRDLPG